MFTATDAAKKTTTVTRTVMIDRTPPGLSDLKSGSNDITTLSSGWQKTSSVSVSGTASDPSGSGISLVEYFVSAGSDTAPADSAIDAGCASIREQRHAALHPDGRQERLVQAFRMRYLFRFEVEHLLARAGFAVEHLYAGYDRSEYGSTYPGELVFVARKAGA